MIFSKNSFFLFLLLLSFSATAQKNYTIKYGSDIRNVDTAAPPYYYEPFELVIQDSVAYCYYPDAMKAKGLTPPIPLGSGYWPKSEFIDPRKGLGLFQDGYPSKPKGQRIVVKKQDKGKWTISTETKVILGYNCIKATGIRNEKNYTIWYCPDLPAGFGPYMLTGLPGTILECMQEEIKLHTLALEIKNEALPVVEPTFCKRARNFVDER